MKNNTICIQCHNEIENYEPIYCCAGIDDCPCMGLPINPPLCSVKCEDAYHDEQIEQLQQLYESLKEKGKIIVGVFLLILAAMIYYFT